MTIKLNENIQFIGQNPIINSKASEIYVSVLFKYDEMNWEGYVPIEYRRTGTSISFEDKDNLHEYLNYVYEEMNPDKLEKWKEEQEKFWETKPKAGTTKSFL